MQRLIEQRDKLLAEIDALKNKVAGLEMAMSLLGGDDHQTELVPVSRPRQGIKGSILDFLTEAGTSGLNAARAVEIAERRGLHMDRQSVSSLLSRLKRDGVVVYEDEQYKLAQFSRTRVQNRDLATLN